MGNPSLLGYDIGSSSIKASLIEAATGFLIASSQSPEQEMRIESPHPGWAEQDPELWWQHVLLATRTLREKAPAALAGVRAIGISYQMHGLVMIDRNSRVLHPAIIWCDSRAVEIGKKAYSDLGEEYCLSRCLNAPGNFTASKLKWVKENRPDLFAKVHKVMLPGDYVAFRMTGKPCTTRSGLSEGILWDFEEDGLARGLMEYFGFDERVIPEVVPTFGEQGVVAGEAASELGIPAGVPVSYRAGDQPNNALSLNVMNPGEVAATAGTSGVIYGITEKKIADSRGRVNTFAHVNYSAQQPNKGILLCINGTGIQYSWLKQTIFDRALTYEEMNELASAVPIGSKGVLCFPFGNGAERMLENRDVGCQFAGINFNIHEKRNLLRAAQEGIAFSFRYGLDILKSIGLDVKIIRAGDSNLFQSEVFREAFVNTCDIDLEIYNTDGAQGAARGAGIGIGLFSTPDEAFKGLKVLRRMNPAPESVERYKAAYDRWMQGLLRLLGD